MTSPRNTAACLWLGMGILGCGSAGTAPSAIVPASHAGATGLLVGKLAEGSTYDRLWSIPTLYKNADNPYLQELAIIGQLQTQYASGSDAAGNYGTDDLSESVSWDAVEVRRFRLGLKAQMFHDFKFFSLIDLNPDLWPHIYKATPETYVTYAPCDAFNVSVGKTELKFTREQELTSRDYLTFERSQLVNMFYGGELTGAWVTGKGIAGGWFYDLGAYSNDREDEFSRFHGGTCVLGKIGYNFSKAADMDLAQVEIHYLYNSEPGYKEAATHLASPAFSNCIAISNDLNKGPYGLCTEAFWGDGDGRANVGGVTVMPTYLFTKKLQLITTFQYASSSGSTGIPLPTRYEQLVPGGKNMNGDNYAAAYAGLNYYFYGQKLKVMSGVKYSSMSGGSNDFSGWTWLAGFRSAF